MTTDEARAFIAKSRWIYASTMPWIPHWYALRRECAQAGYEHEFVAMVVFIREVGEVRPWPRDARVPRYRHTYLDCDDWSYWSMGAPVPETILINRARPEPAAAHEKLAMEVSS